MDIRNINRVHQLMHKREQLEMFLRVAPDFAGFEIQKFSDKGRCVASIEVICDDYPELTETIIDGIKEHLNQIDEELLLL